MPEQKSNEISRDRLAELLNDDLAREYQAIIAYVVYSQVLKGAEYMDIASQLEIHAKQELDHALTLSRQIDSHSVKHSANTRWLNRFARSSFKSRTTKLIWPLLSVKKFLTSTPVPAVLASAANADSLVSIPVVAKTRHH
jgi:hypothetical protein